VFAKLQPASPIRAQLPRRPLASFLGRTSTSLFLIPHSSPHCPPSTDLPCPVGVTAPYRLKSFSCNTYGFPRKCGKQKTYGTAKPFRCNTYKKHGGGREIPPSSERFNACFRPILFPFTLLRTLLQPPRTQLFCFQEIPHSLAKTPGVGVHLHS